MVVPFGSPRSLIRCLVILAPSGTVIAAAPLKIKVEQRFDIASAQLIIPEHLTDRTVDIELDGVKKEMKIYSGLKTGQQVVLIRQQGGQKFLVADRVV